MPTVATSSTTTAPRGGGLPTKPGAPAPSPSKPHPVAGGRLPGRPPGTAFGAPPTVSPAHSGIVAHGNTGPTAIPGANDPAYLAYMREMGVEEADLNILTGHRVNALTRQLGRALPAYAEQRANAVEDAGFAAEDRGLFRSGIRMANQAEAGRAVDRERQDYEAGIRDQIGELNITNAMDIAKLRRQLIEQGLSAAAANVIANAEAGL